jgi:hypothetical protein
MPEGENAEVDALCFRLQRSYCSDAVPCEGLGVETQKQLHTDETTELQQCPLQGDTLLRYFIKIPAVWNRQVCPA